LRFVKFWAGGMLVLLTGCSASQPGNINNICSIFEEKSGWYDDAMAAQERWGAPVHVTMSIMYQESAFRSDVKPPMRYFLFIPIGRGSSAYGYSQAQDPVWEQYVAKADRWFASRSDFGDSIDFIAWYVNQTYKINGISKWDAYNQYLNYHEGWGGFKKKTHASKSWLLKTAKKVSQRAAEYSRQLKKCNL